MNSEHKEFNNYQNVSTFVHLVLLFMHLSMHDALHKSNNHLIVELHITAMYAPNKHKNISK